MANQDSPLWERLGMDCDLSPPWTLFNMVMALNLGLPPKHSTIEEGKALLMVNNKVTYQRQSWIPNAPNLQACKWSLFLLQAMRIVQYLQSSKSPSSILTCV